MDRTPLSLIFAAKLFASERRSKNSDLEHGKKAQPNEQEKEETK